MRLSMIIAGAIVLAFAADAGSQFVSGAVGYDPDIGTVQDGVIHDVRPTVSADRLYVQLDVYSGMAVIEDITEFEVVSGGIFLGP